MSFITLYYLPGSTESEGALELAKLHPDTMALAVDDWWMNTLYRDWGVGRFPVLLGTCPLCKRRGVIATGLESIKRYYGVEEE